MGMISAILEEKHRGDREYTDNLWARYLRLLEHAGKIDANEHKHLAKLIKEIGDILFDGGKTDAVHDKG